MPAAAAAVMLASEEPAGPTAIVERTAGSTLTATAAVAAEESAGYTAAGDADATTAGAGAGERAGGEVSVQGLLEGIGE